MKISRSQLRKIIAESYGDMNDPNNPGVNPGAAMQDIDAKEATISKLKRMVDSDPSIENIRQALLLADSLDIDIEKLKLSLAPYFIKIVQTSNTLDNTQADNIIDEIDDNLFRARDLGLQALGIKTADELRSSGELTDDQIYEIDMELINAVKDKAREAVERAIAQIFFCYFKIIMLGCTVADN